MPDKKYSGDSLPSGVDPVFFASYSSPLGPVYVLGSDKGLLASGLAQKEDDFVRKAAGACCREPQKRPDKFCKLFSIFDEYFMGKKVDFVLDLKPVGTTFELSVWRALSAIPYGQCRSYAWVARVAEGVSAKAYRAVGSACGANPLPLIVPCHRVISSSGSIGGFAAEAGGLPMKRRLLAIEGVRT